MTLTLTDNFNRANSATLGLSWIEAVPIWGGGLEIVSNTVANLDGVAEDVAIWSILNGMDMCTAFTMSVLSTEDFDPMPYFTNAAVTESIQFYMRVPRNGVQMWRGLTQDIDISLSATFVQGDAVCGRLVDNGVTTTAYIYRQAGAVGAWVEVGSGVLNARVPGPYIPGIGIYNNTVTRLDNFYTGNGSPVGDNVLVIRGDRGSRRVYRP